MGIGQLTSAARMPAGPPRAIQRIVLGCGLCCLVLVGVAVAWPLGADSKSESGGTARSIPVETVTVECVTSFEQRRSYTGVIQPRRTSELGFQRNGKLVDILVEEGDRVERGQTLARLDARKLVTRRRELEAKHAEATALLAELEAGPRAETIEAARSELQDLEAQRELAQTSYERNQQLLRRKAVSQQQFDEVAHGLRSLEARLRAAQSRLDELLAGTRPERIAAQEAVVQQLESALSTLRIDLDESTLTAPFPGMIVARHVDEGTVISAGTPVFRIVDDGRLEASIGVPSQTASRLRNGQSQTVVIGGRRYPAVVKTVVPELDAQTRTQMVRLILDSEQAGGIVPGQVLRLEVRETQHVSGFWLPVTALTRGSRGLWSALVVENDPTSGLEITVRRELEVLYTEGDRVLVRGTLRDGERVVASGTHRIVAGQAVDTGPRAASTRQHQMPQDDAIARVPSGPQVDER